MTLILPATTGAPSGLGVAVITCSTWATLPRALLAGTVAAGYARLVFVGTNVVNAVAKVVDFIVKKLFRVAVGR